MECETGNCGSRQFRTGEDGFTYCSEGHRQSQAGLATADENEGLQPTGRRTIRKSQQEDENDAVLTGQEGFEHYLVCFQRILRLQCRSFIDHSGAPNELEVIVRDLWTMRLNELSYRLPGDLHDHDDDDIDRKPATQTFSSQEDTSESDGAIPNMPREKSVDSLLNVTDGLCMLYIGAMLLQMPLLPIHILQKVNDGVILYYRAVRELDSGMTSNLHGRYHLLLAPIRHLKIERLRTDISRTIMLYTKVFGMPTPPLNHQLCLWQFVADLHLPIEVYAGTLRLAHLLKLTFEFNMDGTKRKSSTLGFPDQRLIALLVVTTKMLYPFDGRERPPRKPTEPAALAMNWASWQESMRTGSDGNLSMFQRSLQTTDHEVASMTEERLSQYLEWFRTMFTTHELPTNTVRQERHTNFKQSLQRMFPVEPSRDFIMTEDQDHPPGSGAIACRTEDITSTMEPVRILGASSSAADDYTSRPGSAYVRYRHASNLPTGSATALFYDNAAAMIGSRTEAVVQGVFTVEKMIDKILAQ